MHTPAHPLPPPAFPACAEPERATGWPLVAVWVLAVGGSWAGVIGVGVAVWRAVQWVAGWMTGV